MTSRMSFDERRDQILRSVRRIFSSRGLAGATTRDLAKAAGVSEALLFQHFKSKEALYDAMIQCSDQYFFVEIKKIQSLDSSTSTLILLIHFLFSNLLAGENPEMQVFARLYLRSLTEDGKFARVVISNPEGVLETVRKIEQCLKASLRAGDVLEGSVPLKTSAWFSNRLAIALMCDFLPKSPVVNYGVSREKLVEHAVRFVLRGFGIKEDVIRRHYNPKGLSLMAG